MDNVPERGYFNIKTEDKKSLITPDRFKQKGALGIGTFNALQRAGFASPPSSNDLGDPVYGGLDMDRVKTTLAKGEKIPGVGPSGLEKLIKFLTGQGNRP